MKVQICGTRIKTVGRVKGKPIIKLQADDRIVAGLRTIMYQPTDEGGFYFLQRPIQVHFFKKSLLKLASFLKKVAKEMD